MRLTRIFLTVAAIALTCPVASAQAERAPEVFTYFNRPGATLTEHGQAIESCLRPALEMMPPDSVPVSRRAVYPEQEFASSGLIGVLAASAYLQRSWREVVAWHVSINIENCMLSNGWRVVELDRDTGRALARIRQGSLVERLAPWISAETPEGRIARHPEGNSDPRVAWATATLWRIPSSLSTRATGHDRDISDRIRERWERATGSSTWYGAPPSKPSNEADLADAQSSFVAVTVRGAGRIIFHNVEHPGSIIAAQVDGEDGPTLYAVPAGRWRISSIIVDNTMVSFCLGAPVFDVPPGEIVYLGAFNFEEEIFGPALSTEVEDSLAGLALPDTITRTRAANYFNGHSSACTTATFIYRYAIPGAPSLE